MLLQVVTNHLSSNLFYQQLLSKYNNPIYSIENLVKGFVMPYVAEQAEGQEFTLIPVDDLNAIVKECLSDVLDTFNYIENYLSEIIKDNKKFKGLSKEEQAQFLPLLFYYLYSLYAKSSQLPPKQLKEILSDECGNRIQEILKVIDEMELVLEAYKETDFEENDDDSDSEESDDEEQMEIHDLLNPLKVYFIIADFVDKYKLPIKKGEYRLMISIIYSLKEILSVEAINEIQASLMVAHFGEEKLQEYMYKVVVDTIIPGCVKVCCLLGKEISLEQKIQQFILKNINCLNSELQRIMKNDVLDPAFHQNVMLAIQRFLELEFDSLCDKRLSPEMMQDFLLLKIKKELPKICELVNTTINNKSNKAPITEVEILQELDQNRGATTKKSSVTFKLPGAPDEKKYASLGIT